ncbi:sigma-54 interaction domain-containing protein [Alkalihalobacterium alkalinitrilicum]|uniref:sigma-54 interaction domain-containing protein n=1 Tax=Alkalihalobacterium alkalinitrilicum TaxID=427920 RepID=UPI001303782A|nr:sigma 54-interacting transcriptional regulator [Alkalihalobacterium alkalinitrilicum]
MENKMQTQTTVKDLISQTKITRFLEMTEQPSLLFKSNGDLIFANKLAYQLFKVSRINSMFTNFKHSFLSQELFALGNQDRIERTRFIDEIEYNCSAQTIHFGPKTFFIESYEPRVKEVRTSKSVFELERMIDFLRDGIYITDAKGITLHINKKYSELTGINKHEVIGRHVSELIYKGFFDDSITLKVLEQKKPVTILQKTKEGNQIWLVTGNPILDSNGRIIQIFNTVYDMTELNQLRESLKNKEMMNQIQKAEIQKLRDQISHIPDLIGTSESLKKVKKVIHKVAKINSSILILGETGSGKNVVAKAIHDLSDRSANPFIEVNCGALPEHLIETELFGYVSGAFTGANKQGKKGLLEVAHQGTLFLDEIGEMPQHLQVKLLTFLQDQKVRRVGGSEYVQVDVRIIAATNKDLEQLIIEEKFREDLYYRISVVPIKLPPLREHKEDIYILVNSFLEKFNTKHNCNVKLTKATYLALEKYHWPGNVRELKHLMEQLVVLADEDLISISDLPDRISTPIFFEADHDSKTLDDIMNRFELQIIKETWEELRDVKQVSDRLGIHRTTLIRKTNKLGLALDKNR